MAKETTIGFALLSRGKSPGLNRLVRTLNSIFDNPEISIHHDFSQGSPEVTELPSNTHFIQDWSATQWGRWNLVDAMMKSVIELSERKNSPDWVINLSESDYPAASAEEIINRLQTTPYDAHIHHERICEGMEHRLWHHICRERYMQSSENYPFSESYPCFAGEFWFMANRKAARELINQYRTPSKLRLHLEELDEKNPITIPDECFFATTLANSQIITASTNNLRFVNWEPARSQKEGERPIQAGPTILTDSHLDIIESSGALFIRKIHADKSEKLLSKLDQKIITHKKQT